jgi:hypothetical protein
MLLPVPNQEAPPIAVLEEVPSPPPPQILTVDAFLRQSKRPRTIYKRRNRKDFEDSSAAAHTESPLLGLPSASVRTSPAQSSCLRRAKPKRRPLGPGKSTLMKNASFAPSRSLAMTSDKQQAQLKKPITAWQSVKFEASRLSPLAKEPEEKKTPRKHCHYQFAEEEDPLLRCPPLEFVSFAESLTGYTAFQDRIKKCAP